MLPSAFKKIPFGKLGDDIATVFGVAVTLFRVSLSKTFNTLVAPVLFVTSIPSIPSCMANIWTGAVVHNSIKPRLVVGLTKFSVIISEDWFVSELVASIVKPVFELQ